MASKKAKAGLKVRLPTRTGNLAGHVTKNDDFLPHMDLRGPEEDIKLDPEIDDDCTMSVHYQLPTKTHVHKSMLFPGVVLPQPVLDKADINILKFIF